MTPAVLGHAISGRRDLPIPDWLFLAGAALAVIISFVALAAAWPKPRLQGPTVVRPVPLLERDETEVALGTLGVFLFVATLVACFAGPGNVADNFAPYVIFVLAWVGVPVLSVVLGPVGVALNPWRAIASVPPLAGRTARPLPAGVGVWPAVGALLVFLWLELGFFPFSQSAAWLGVFLIAYTVFLLAGCARFGRDAWLDAADFLTVYTRLAAGIAPLGPGVDADGTPGRFGWRRPLAPLTQIPWRPGLSAFVTTLLGSTTFDGFTESDAWRALIGDAGPGARLVWSTAGLVLACALVLALFRGACIWAARVGGKTTAEVEQAFTHTLVPIALAYAVAHYFSLLVLQGSIGLALLVGWNALRIPLTALSANTIWIVQVVAIVAGHVAGVVLAHDRAVAMFRRSRVVRGQWAMLVLMVVFTVGGLQVLS